ncbi:NGG1 interacting factor [Rhizoclosmatium sp. JEL0117]|nr:NGG1 interacting factor [Rhizoclosmatium sp. JEL0117]
MSKTTPLLTRVSNVLFGRIAPTGLAEAWDNVGLLIEAPVPRAGGNKVFLTIDLTLTTLEEALADPHTGVIIAYHPPLFSSFKRLTTADVKQRIALLCAAHGVSVLSPHTALDTCAGGLNDWLAEAFPSHKRAPISELDDRRKEIAASLGQAKTAGVGRLVTLNQAASLYDLIQAIKKHLNLPHVRLALPEGKTDPRDVSIRTIAICAGSGNSVCSKAKKADLYFTGEMGHHEVMDATSKGTAVVLCEHSNTERGYLSQVLQQKLQELLNGDGSAENVEVVVSKRDSDPLVIV